jgi:hypothetical protein
MLAQVSSSAFDAAAQHWPELFAGLDPGRVAAVKAGLRRTRPRLVEGYEALVMARLLLESADNEGGLLPPPLCCWHAVSLVGSP